ncbi:MAG TPA: phage portal protein [Burkholderiales bacterium]|nr:phage portal protein [Burkholderiales bacterium]
MAAVTKLVDASGNPLRTKAEAFAASSYSAPEMRRWHPRPGSADADLIPEQGRIVSRSRDLARNHGIADGARQTHLDNVVGCGLRLKAKPNWQVLKRQRDWADEWAQGVEARWQGYWGTTQPDAADCLNGDGLTAQVFNSAWMNGEFISLPLWMPGRLTQQGMAQYATCHNIVEPDRLSNPYGAPNTPTLRGGVEIDAYGKPLAYNFRTTHPGDVYFAGAMYVNDAAYGRWERVPAMTPWGRRRVIHGYDRELRPGQSRGIPALASVMKPFKTLGDFTQAELNAAIANALVAIVLESNLSQEAIVELFSSNPDALKAYQDGLSQRNRSAIDHMGAQIIPVPLGDKVSSFSPGRPSSNYDPFVTSFLRWISVGLHLPYELLMKDFSKTNYSSARAALLEAWRFFNRRRKWLSEYWMQPAYELWLEEEINAGEIEDPGFYTQRAAVCRATWVGDGRGWVDPLKEVEAAALRVAQGFSTLEAECAEQGRDWRDVVEQKARELKYIKDLEAQYGISFSAPAPAVLSPAKAKETNAEGEATAGDQPSGTTAGPGGVRINEYGHEVDPAYT